MKLRRRTKQWYTHMWENDLRRKILSSKRVLAKEIPALTEVKLINMDDDLRTIDNVLDELIEEAKASRLERFREIMNDEIRCE